MTNTETTYDAANNAEQGATVAPEKVPTNKSANPNKGLPKSIQGNAQHTTPFNKSESVKVARAKVSPKTTTRAKEAKDEPRVKTASERGNKKGEVIAMMKRAKGATLSEIVGAIGWQKHTVPGFVSLLGSKGSEKIESSKNASDDRNYHIAK